MPLASFYPEAGGDLEEPQIQLVAGFQLSLSGGTTNPPLTHEEVEGGMVGVAGDHRNVSSHRGDSDRLGDRA